MKILFYFFPIVGILFCLENPWVALTEQTDTSTHWDFVKEVDGIKIFTKDVEHSNIKELKIEMTFEQTSLSDIISIVGRCETYQDWMYKCSHSENISYTAHNDKIDYFQLDFPWPLTDRDLYNRSIIHQDTATKILTIASDPVDTFEERDGFIRVTESKTRWRFYPQTNGDVFLRYTTASSPAGHIPDWLVNMVIDKGPTQTMLKLKELIAENKGNHEPIEWIRE